MRWRLENPHGDDDVRLLTDKTGSWVLAADYDRDMREARKLVQYLITGRTCYLHTLPVNEALLKKRLETDSILNKARAFLARTEGI